MNKKYILYPGEVISMSDKQIHYISAVQLANLYGVSIQECYVFDLDRPNTYIGKDFSGLIPLHVQSKREDYKIK